MEFEQIVKKLDWLDEQQRKSKLDFGDQNGRLASMEAILNGLMQQMKTLSQQLNDLQPLPARINQFDQIIIKQRADLGKMVDAVEKSVQQREHETAKLHAVQIEEVGRRYGTGLNRIRGFHAGAALNRLAAVSRPLPWPATVLPVCEVGRGTWVVDIRMTHVLMPGFGGNRD